jgi:hypothetical protein
MKILSIDVGIKNLSYCLFETQSSEPETKHIKVLKWDNIDLSEKNNFKCIEVDKNGLCNKPAKFSKDQKCYCLKHSKKHNYLQLPTEFKESHLKKQKLQNLIDIADKYKLTYEKPPKKSNILGIIQEFINNNCYTPIIKTNATKVDLVTIGRNIQHKFNDIFVDVSSIDTIIIENQIGPIANKMKTIQGMISQYFIMKNNNVNIEFVSASNKLKDFLPNEKIDYKQRKKLGIQTCLSIVNSDFRFKEWETFVNKHTKKDDLSDCFLQGLWFIKHKIV